MLVSGSGSNLQALIDHRGAYEIGLVLSDRPHVQALERAAAAGLPTRVVEWAGDRESFTRAVCDAVDEAGAELMVLAGFMRILGPQAIDRFPGRILNIHPSLLPAFPGSGAVRQALEARVPTTGVTVHLVDELVDHGPILAQVEVPVLADDDEGSLHARIQVQEHLLYPQVVERVARGEMAAPAP